jgi:hypothetical protein
VRLAAGDDRVVPLNMARRGKQSRREDEPRRPIFGWRVWLLPMFFWPLILDVPVELIRGGSHRLVGTLLGLGLAWLAASMMAQGRRRAGARLFGVAAGLSAGLAAGIAPPIAVALGFGAWFGARLLTEDLPESEPEKPPEVTILDALDGPRAQLSRIAASAPGLPLGGQLLEAAGAMQAVIEELEARPARLHEARRFLAVHLDGLSRIVDRLEAGAEPPPTLPSLLTELTQSAHHLRGELRVAESEALDIQVKVLAQRLRQEDQA